MLRTCRSPVLLPLLLLCAGVLVSPAMAIQYQGSLTYAGGGVTDGTGWAGDLSWNVWWTGSAWRYEYDLDTWLQPGFDRGGGISHVIIETSPDTVANDFTYWVPDGDDAGTDWDLWTPTTLTFGATGVSPGNPGIPGDIYGIRFESTPTGSSSTHWEWAIETWRSPVWGDFYVKDGVAGYLYNSDTFDDDGSASTGVWSDDPWNGPADGSVNFNILRPDTEGDEPPTPELPTTGLLLLSGVPMGMFWWRRKRA